MSRDAFEEIIYEKNCDQVRITIEDYVYTDRVLERLREMGYMALSPFREGSTKVDAALAAERQQTLMVCALALLAVLALQVIVLRALFSAQTESYRLMSAIGLTCPVAKRSVLWQVLLFTLLGQLLGLGALLACRAAGVERVVSMLRYLPPAYLLAFGAVHLAAALVAALWVSRAMAKQVFPMTARRSDLSLDEEVMA